jgi:PKD repeat protein
MRNPADISLPRIGPSSRRGDTPATFACIALAFILALPSGLAVSITPAETHSPPQTVGASSPNAGDLAAAALQSARSSLDNRVQPSQGLAATCAAKEESGHCGQPLIGGVSPSAANSTWTNLTSWPQPKVTQSSAMAYDAADGYVLLFGGVWCGATTCYYSNETWSYQNGVWTNLTAMAGTPPAGRFGMGLAYDSSDGYVVAFGGSTGGNCNGVPHPCDDTWTYAGGHWSHIAPSCWFPGRGISSCSNTEFENGAGTSAAVELVDDPADGYVFMSTSGGNNTDSGGGGTGVWTYRAGTWSDWNLNHSSLAVLRTPVYGALGYDSGDGYVVAFGGSSAHGYSDQYPWELPNNNTWRWANGLWINITATAGSGPSPRFGSSLSVDSTSGDLLLYGGTNYTCRLWTNYQCVNFTTAGNLNDTWSLAGGRWVDLNATTQTGIRNGFQGSLVDDPADGGVLSFGSWSCFEAPCPTYAENETDLTWLFSAAPPLVNLTVYASASAVDTGVSDNFSESFVGGTPPISFTWNFGDGYSSTSPASSHAFQGSGFFLVTLTVNDSAAHALTASVAVQVAPVPGVSIQVNPNPTDVRLPTSFAALLAGGTGPFSYAWLFGDGGSSTLQSPSHTYSIPTNFSVQLWVNDSGGSSALGRVVVSVNPPVVLSLISATPNPVVLGRPVNFSISATGGATPYTYAWTFGDGGTGGNLANITHIYTTNGPFVAIAIVTDAAGESANQRINMTIALNASIFSNASLGAAPLPVAFQSVVQGGTPGYSYAWDFGDGVQGSVPDPVHTYVASGDYRATLRVTDRAGMTAISTWLESVATGGGRLAIHLTASLSNLPTGGLTTIVASPQGGFGRYVLTWSGYPPGCIGSTPTSLNCTPTADGSYTVVANVTDATGATAQATVVIAVGVSSPGAGDLSGVTAWIVAGLLGAVAVGVVVAVATRGRSRRSAAILPSRLAGKYGRYVPGVPSEGRTEPDPAGSPSEDSLGDLI